MQLMHRSSLLVSLSLIVALTACKKDSESPISDEEINRQIVVQANDASRHYCAGNNIKIKAA